MKKCFATDNIPSTCCIYAPTLRSTKFSECHCIMDIISIYISFTIICSPLLGYNDTACSNSVNNYRQECFLLPVINSYENNPSFPKLLLQTSTEFRVDNQHCIYAEEIVIHQSQLLNRFHQ